MSLADELLADLEDLEDDEEEEIEDVGGPADEHEKDVATVIGDASISRRANPHTYSKFYLYSCQFL